MLGEQVRNVIQETRRAPREAPQEPENRLTQWWGRVAMTTFPEPQPVGQWARGGVSYSF
jgi:hypothetical protein